MFDDIGGNIKVLAKIQFCIGAVMFCIAGISTIYIGNIMAGVLMIVLGILGSWIATFFVYGFGELIESTVSLNRNVERLHNDNMNMQQLLDQLPLKNHRQSRQRLKIRPIKRQIFKQRQMIFKQACRKKQLPLKAHYPSKQKKQNRLNL